MAKAESKSYDPAATEKRIFDFWMQGGYFHPQPDDRPREQRFCMVIPPPNVTGALHLGHALNNTLQDILVRQQRMLGKNVLWLVGTDHAGIATQATVETTIRKTEGKSRHDLGREELVRRIWEWKEKFGGRILEQLKLMGCSCDYQRERFTLDDICAKAVRHTFFKMFRDGLIYRGKRLVNWDTQLQTAVADDEVYHEEVAGHFYHLKYPVNNPQPGEPQFVHVATTRPETMLGDVAVAVHPDPDKAMDTLEGKLKSRLAAAPERERADIQKQLDDLAARRTTHLPTLRKLRDMVKAGRTVTLPLAERVIPLICDEWAKPELGSGCVKITPAHDPNDYEVAQRHDLPRINVLTPDGKVAEIIEADGTVNKNSPKYVGLKFATDGRKKVVEDLQAAGLIENIEDRLIDIGHSDRSKTPIEPFLSDQWFVKMGDLTEQEASRVQSEFMNAYIKRGASGSPPDKGGRGGVLGQRGDSRTVNHYPGLAQLAIDAVERTAVEFHPPRYEKTYVDWLSEKRDWCISRQLWWGHRIPVWHKRYEKPTWGEQGRPGWSQADDVRLRDVGHVVVTAAGQWSPVPWDDQVLFHWPEGREADQAIDVFVCLSGEESGCEEMRRELEVEGFRQDPDVLDTWFSSALWPHSTLGWPDSDALACGSRPTAGEIPLWTKRIKLTAENWTKELLSQGIDSLIEGRWSAPPETVELRVVNLQTRVIVADPKGAFFPVVADTSGEYEFQVRLLKGDNKVEGLLAGAGFERSKALAPGSPLNKGDDQQSLLGYFYPTNVLSTAREIITLWVARMVITGLYNIGQIPFTDVVIHSVIQDGQGRKMSKTAGNGVDPVDIIDKYGADAMRFTLADLATETQDIRMPVKKEKLPDGRTINVSEKFEKGRNFCNKLWQAATGYVLPNSEGLKPKPLEPESLRLEDRWILSRMTTCLGELETALKNYRFSDAVNVLYHFMWDDYCSWYIEMSKPRLKADDAAATQQVLIFVLDQLLRMLHPVAPFITEALWHELNRAHPQRGLTEVFEAKPALVTASWPSPGQTLRDATVESQMAVLHAIIRTIREVRTEVNDYRAAAKQPSMRTLPLVAIRTDRAAAELIHTHKAFITALANCDSLEVGTDIAKPTGSWTRVCGAAQVFVPVGDLVDLAAVRSAEQAKLLDLQAALQREQARLENENFVKRAEPSIVDASKQRAADLSNQITLLQQHLSELQ